MTNQAFAPEPGKHSPSPSTMKAVRVHGRGGASGLFYEDAPFPKLTPGDAIVRVHATGITPTELEWDETYKNQDGSPRIPGIIGHEVAGTIHSVAADVADLLVGDRVYGLTDFPRDGAAAEYVAVRAVNLAPMPATIDYAHAAALTLSGLTAWQAFFTHTDLSRGQKVLIHGGAGGVGVFAVQLARWRGAHVSVTAQARDFDFLRDLGAQELIDYKAQRFDELLSNQDMVLDTIGGETQERSWKTLRKGGAMINLTAPLPQEKLSEYGVRGVFFIVEANRKDLIELAKLVDAGELKSVVSRTLPLFEARKAFEPASGHRSPGKTVLKIRD